MVGSELKQDTFLLGASTKQFFRPNRERHSFNHPIFAKKTAIFVSGIDDYANLFTRNKLASTNSRFKPQIWDANDSIKKCPLFLALNKNVSTFNSEPIK